MSRWTSVAMGAAGLLVGATAMATAGAHWNSGNVNAVNRLLGARSGWQLVYVPPPDADLPPPDADHGLFATIDRCPGLDQHIAISTLPPPDADLPPPDADRPVNVVVPGDATSPTLISWQQPPEPDLPPGPGIDLALPADPHANVVIDLVPPPDADRPPLTIEYPPDPGVPITFVIPTGANLALRDTAGNRLALCGAGTNLPPGGQ